jgi:predicted small lipoprotein YifL
MVDQNSVRLGLAALLAVALVGCGQKGPLYLPDAASEVVTRPAAGEPDPGEQSAAPPADADTAAPAAAPEAPDAKKEKGVTAPPAG